MAFAIDWPGWSRGAKTADLALETLESYRERYRPVAELAGMVPELDAAGALEVVEDRVGTGSTDFWGISFSPCTVEEGPMGEAELERGITLLQACWAFFDGVAARVSPEMRKGVRGGGRDRDEIIRHTIRVESEDFARKVGLRIPEDSALTPDGLQHHRATYVAAMRAYNAGEVARTHAVVDAPVPHPPLRLPHARPRVGDGGQGSLRRGRGLTRRRYPGSLRVRRSPPSAAAGVEPGAPARGRPLGSRCASGALRGARGRRGRPRPRPSPSRWLAGS